MPLKTVSDLKDSVAGILSGLDLQNVDNLYGAFQRAVRVLIQKADIPEASGLQNIILYDGVTDYPANTDIFGTAIRDIRPQGISRNPWDFVNKQFDDDFDRQKGWLPSGVKATFEYNAGVPTIRIVSANVTPKAIIDSLTDDTGWVASGSASGLAVDGSNYYQSPGSLRFTLTGASVGLLTKTLTTPLDLSDDEDLGVAFLAIQIPSGATAANLTSIQLKLGSSSGNYNNVSNTTGFLGAWVAGQWLLVAFDFSAASETGTPDWSAIDYVQVSITHAGTFTNFHVGGLWISIPRPNQILYQTAAVFQESGSSPSTNIASDNDTILFNDPAFTLFEHEASIAVLEQTGGATADSTLARLESKLNGARARNGQIITLGLYDLYKGNNPSQSLRQAGSYYDMDDVTQINS